MITKSHGKKKYTQKDEMLIKEYYKEYGERSFEMLSKILVPNRQSRSIREHYEDFLKDGLNHSEFTEMEDMDLIKYVTLFGKKWRRITLYIPQRSCGMLKNRYQILEKKIKNNEISKDGKRNESYFYRKKNIHQVPCEKDNDFFDNFYDFNFENECDFTTTIENCIFEVD